MSAPVPRWSISCARSNHLCPRAISRASACPSRKRFARWKPKSRWRTRRLPGLHSQLPRRRRRHHHRRLHRRHHHRRKRRRRRYPSHHQNHRPRRSPLRRRPSHRSNGVRPLSSMRQGRHPPHPSWPSRLFLSRRRCGRPPRLVSPCSASHGRNRLSRSPRQRHPSWCLCLRHRSPARRHLPTRPPGGRSRLVRAGRQL